MFEPAIIYFQQICEQGKKRGRKVTTSFIHDLSKVNMPSEINMCVPVYNRKENNAATAAGCLIIYKHS